MREVIDRIRETEKKAEQIRNDAQLKASELVSAARNDGKKTVDDAIIQANRKADEMVAAAEKTADASVESQISAAKAEAEEILARAEARKEAAISLILERIVSS